LKWYPRKWRERYGDEFVAYLDDELAGRRPTLRFLFSIALGAARERGHASGLLGAEHAPVTQVRAGSLLIFCAWSVFMFAGASFSKLSEHSAQAMTNGTGSLARIGFDVVASCGALGMILVLVGACVALPSFIALLRDDWPSIRPRVLVALFSTTSVVGVLVPLAIWAHHLTESQRNGSDGAYSAAFVVWAILIALTLVSWDRMVVQCVSMMNLSPRVLRVEAQLAAAVSLMMVAITVGAALWWVDVARNAPWFLQGTTSATASSPLTPNLIVTLGLMLGAACLGAFGVRRIAHSWRRV
jgi:hypothetical protein